MTLASIKVMHERIIDLEPHLLAALEPLFLIPTHLTFEERMYLFQTAALAPDGFTACEIGSYLGASTSFIACMASFKKGSLHAIDTWKNDAMTENSYDTFSEFCKNTYNYRHIITAHRGKSSECHNNIPANLDLLFIDGDHSYKQTLQDMRNYIPKVKKGGIVIMHDTNRDVVQQAIAEYSEISSLSEIGTTHTMKAMRLT